MTAPCETAALLPIWQTIFLVLCAIGLTLGVVATSRRRA